ncbi:MAG: aspartate aminotransferase family protein [Oligoflexia bacterium]|nr:aspartate aminotransferase family protein [Oligoflexia bacterium]
MQKMNEMFEKINQPRNQRPKIITKDIPGSSSKQMRAEEEQLLAPGIQGLAVMAGIVVEAAQGSAITDVDGNIFLDIIGGIGVGGIGHSHPTYIAALSQQLSKSVIGSFSSVARLQLLKLLREHLPTQLERVQLYSSGAEAVESALRLAKAYTNKWEFVSCWGGFHGKTMGALSLMGSDFKNEYGPLVPGNHLIPYADCYRCPFKSTHPQCGLLCIEYARKQLKLNVSKGIAGIIVEPVQGTAGNIIPPKDYLQALAELAKEWDALLIADEMITGFGRTGSYWGCEQSDVMPDIITIGKQFGGGFPISAVVSSKKICDSFPWAKPSGSSSSYGGNPLAAAAAAATLKIIDDEGLVKNSQEVGAHFLQKIQEFPERYPFVGKVSGKGLLLGIELVEDQKSKVPLNTNATQKIFYELLHRGVLSMSYSPHFRLQPAMTIDCQTVDNIVGIIKEVFDLGVTTRPGL